MAEIDFVLTLSNMLYAAAFAMLVLTVMSFVAGTMVSKDSLTRAEARFSVSLVAACVTVLLGAMAAAVEHMPMDSMGTPNLAFVYWLTILGIAGMSLLILLFKGDL